jgi:deoxycytidine triphosphate deaminase
MAILTDKEIQDLINKNQLVVGANNDLINPSSYDMRVGTIFRDGQIINRTHVRGSDPVIVKPGEVVTMLTQESLELPANIAATAYAMNSQSLDGFLVLNPGHVDPGYKGSLSIKAINLRKVDLCLSIGEQIFTVVFQKLEQNVLKPYSKVKNKNDRELEINKNEVEKSMKSIADLMSFTPEDIDKRIAKHWSNKIYNSLAFAAAVFSIISAVFTGLQFFKKPDASKESLTPIAPIINITNSSPPLTSNSEKLNKKHSAQNEKSSSVKKLKNEQ